MSLLHFQNRIKAKVPLEKGENPHFLTSEIDDFILSQAISEVKMALKSTCLIIEMWILPF